MKISVAPDSSVSPEFQEAFTQLVDELPTYLSTLLGKHGYQIFLARLVVDLYPELSGKPLISQAEGWNLEKREIQYFDNIKGAHDPDELMLIYPEYYRQLGSWDIVENKKKPSKCLLYHEIGHAIDCLPTFSGFWLFSESLQFIDAYCRDLEKLSLNELNTLDYQLNHSPRMRKEIFADTFSAIFCPEEDYTERQRKYFPLTMTYIQKGILQNLSEIYDNQPSLRDFYAKKSYNIWNFRHRLLHLLGFKSQCTCGSFPQNNY